MRRTLAAFERCEEIDELILVAGDAVRDAVAEWTVAKLTAVVPGGAARHLSVWAGIEACARQAEIIAVHDGARPLIQPRQISRCIAAARERGAVVCARPLTETIKRADASGRLIESLDRTGVWIMETPQVFQRGLLVAAYQKVLQDDREVTDETSALLHLGEEVFVIENHEPNPKVTFPSDLELAERNLASLTP